MPSNWSTGNILLLTLLFIVAGAVAAWYMRVAYNAEISGKLGEDGKDMRVKVLPALRFMGLAALAINVWAWFCPFVHFAPVSTWCAAIGAVVAWVALAVLAIMHAWFFLGYWTEKPEPGEDDRRNSDKRIIDSLADLALADEKIGQGWVKDPAYDDLAREIRVEAAKRTGKIRAMRFLIVVPAVAGLWCAMRWANDVVGPDLSGTTNPVCPILWASTVIISLLAHLAGSARYYLFISDPDRLKDAVINCGLSIALLVLSIAYVISVAFGGNGMVVIILGIVAVVIAVFAALAMAARRFLD